MKPHHSKSLEETEAIAGAFLAEISNARIEDSVAKEYNEATVIGLSGNLGSGKTTFVQAVARHLGIEEKVTSPTFVIMKFYETDTEVGPMESWKRLVHIDAYRLERPEEMEALNFEQVVSDPGNLVLIEWPENVKGALPESIKTIKFENTGEGERRISY